MTLDSVSGSMEDKAEQLGIQFSSIDLNSTNPPPTPPQLVCNFNFSEFEEVFYDDYGFIPAIRFGDVIVVSNLPIVEARMAHELESEIRVLFSEHGVIKEDGFSMPVSPTSQETLGHCFIEFNSRQEAELAMNKKDGYNFYNLKMSVSLYDAFDSMIDIPDMGTSAETGLSFHGSSRHPGSPSILSPVTEEDVELCEEGSEEDDIDNLMQWNELDNHTSSDEFREVIEFKYDANFRGGNNSFPVL